MEFLTRNYQHFHTNHFQKPFQLADSNVYYIEFCVVARTTTLDTFCEGIVDNIHSCFLVKSSFEKDSNYRYAFFFFFFTDSLNCCFLQNLKEIEI